LLQTVTVSATSASALGSASSSGLLATVQINDLAGYAAVNATVFGDLATVNIPASWTVGSSSGAIGGSALGGSPTSAGSGLTVYQLAGYADALTLASGLVGTITVSNLAGSATVSVVGAGGFGSITTAPMAATVEITNFIRASVVISERLLGACTVSDALVRGTCTVSSRVLYTCLVGDEPVGDVQIGAALRYDATVFAGVL
jgi:hypothetical protein